MQLDQIEATQRRKPTLRTLRGLPPSGKTGRISQLLPDIDAALASGHSLKTIWEVAAEDGFDISYKQFSCYLGRARRRLKGSKPERDASPVPEPILIDPAATPPPPVADPFANLRTARERKRANGFEYDPFSTNKDLI